MVPFGRSRGVRGLLWELSGRSGMRFEVLGGSLWGCSLLVQGRALSDNCGNLDFDVPLLEFAMFWGP